MKKLIYSTNSGLSNIKFESMEQIRDIGTLFLNLDKVSEMYSKFSSQLELICENDLNTEILSRFDLSKSDINNMDLIHKQKLVLYIAARRLVEYDENTTIIEDYIEDTKNATK